jgi:hypothetical protein
MTVAERLACVTLAVLLPVAAVAQDAQVQFWLKGDPKNIQGCIAADPSFTREHTFLLVNGQAEIKSAGGINIKMKPVRANVYRGDFDLGRMNLDVVADLSATPKTLTVTNPDLGCKWTAQRE